jgi:hypothetical protein
MLMKFVILPDAIGDGSRRFGIDSILALVDAKRPLAESLWRVG